MNCHLFKNNQETGFTLIEVLIAMVILIIGILTLYTMQTTAVRGNVHANKITEAATWDADQVERMLGLDYNSAALLKDTDKDGTGQDLNHDGVDDNGGNFGLDDTGSAADGTASSQDGGRYTISWNIARDVPMPNLKTIRVIVQDNQKILSAPVVFTYIKADVI